MNLTPPTLRALIPSLLLVQLAACSSNDSTDAADTTAPVDTTLTGNLDWITCEDAATFECASLKVPMDYSQPDREQIDIALTRRAASGTDRQGSLLFNFGGPGGTGVDVLQSDVQDNFIPDSILSAYDLIGFDPRGVGGSTPVDCTEEGAGEVNTYPVDADQVTQLHADYSQIAAACTAKYNDYLQHLGSLNVVRDMDRIRVALGDEKLNFVGMSYGTRLAALYLQEFPGTSGRIVLDASILPDSSVRRTLLGSLPAMQANLLSVLSECTITDPECDPGMLLRKLSERATALVIEDSEASRGEFNLLIFIVNVVIDDSELGLLASSTLVEYANTSNAAVLEMLLEPFVGPSGVEQIKGGGGDEDEDAGVIVETAVFCADDAARPDAATLVSALVEFNQASDFFAEQAISVTGQCAGWPEALEPLAPIVTSTAPISLVIGGTSDAFTPLAWSTEMATQIGGVFIRSNHDGHTGVFVDKSDCIDDIVAAFLLDGMTPAVQECL